MKIKQISVWVAMVTSAAAISQLESAHFYVGKNHKNNSSQRISFILFYSVANA